MTDEEKQRAFDYVKYSDEDVTVDDIEETKFSESYEGVWVSCWIWVPTEVVRGE